MRPRRSKRCQKAPAGHHETLRYTSISSQPVAAAASRREWVTLDSLETLLRVERHAFGLRAHRTASQYDSTATSPAWFPFHPMFPCVLSCEESNASCYEDAHAPSAASCLMRHHVSINSISSTAAVARRSRNDCSTERAPHPAPQPSEGSPSRHTVACTRVCSPRSWSDSAGL